MPNIAKFFQFSAPFNKGVMALVRSLKFLPKKIKNQKPIIFCQYCGKPIDKEERLIVLNSEALHCNDGCVLSYWQKKLTLGEAATGNLDLYFLSHKMAKRMAKKREIHYQKPFERKT